MEAPVPTVGSISSRCSGKERTLLSTESVLEIKPETLKRIEKSLHPNVLLSRICAKKRSKFKKAKQWSSDRIEDVYF